jgi:flagellar motor switch protein FliN/FliY
VATLDNVSLDISVGRGAIIELDAGEDDDVKILANNLPVAEGTVVVNGNRIAVEVKRVLPKSPDMR